MIASVLGVPRWVRVLAVDRVGILDGAVFPLRSHFGTTDDGSTRSGVARGKILRRTAASQPTTDGMCQGHHIVLVNSTVKEAR